jgi:hypothetical protein
VDFHLKEVSWGPLASQNSQINVDGMAGFNGSNVREKVVRKRRKMYVA